VSRPTTIYGIIDPRNNECRYVGKSSHYVKRKRGHIREVEKGGTSYKNNWLRGLLGEGFEPVFIELEVIPTSEDWVEAEVFWIAYLKSIGARLCNLTIGGEGVPGRLVSEENRRKSSERNTGKVMSEEARLRMSIAKTGVKHTEEQNAAKSLRSIGRKHSEVAKKNMSMAMKGIKRSEEGKFNMSGEKSVHSKVTEEAVKELLLEWYSSSNKCRDMHLIGLKDKSIWCILAGQNWKHLDWYREELIEIYGDKPRKERTLK